MELMATESIMNGRRSRGSHTAFLGRSRQTRNGIHHSLFSIMAAFLLWGAACSPERTYTVSGRVTGSWQCVDMASTMHPTTITLNPLERTFTFTHAQPEFAFASVPPGAYTLSVACTAALGQSYPAMPLRVSDADVSVELILPFPDLPRRDPTLILEGHTGPVQTLAFASDNSGLASAALDGRLIQWDLTTGQPGQTWSHGQTAGRYPLVLSPDGSRLAAAAEDGRVRLWQTARGTPRPSLMAPLDYVEGLAFSADGRWLAAWSSGESSLVVLWDVVAGELLETLDVAGDEEFNWRIGKAIRFLPAGDTMAVALMLNRELTLQRWNMSTASQRQSWTRLAPLPQPLSHITTLAISHSNDALALGAADIENTGRLIIWHFTSGRTLGQRYEAPLRAVEFSPDGRRVASTSADNSVVLWDAEGGEAQALLVSDQSGLIPIAWSADGRTLASADEAGRVLLWSVGER